MSKIRHKDRIVNETLDEMNLEGFTEKQIEALKNSLASALPDENAFAVSSDVRQLSDDLKSYMAQTDERIKAQEDASSAQNSRIEELSSEVQSASEKAESTGKSATAAINSFKDSIDFLNSTDGLSGKFDSLVSANLEEKEAFKRKLDEEFKRRVAIEGELKKQIGERDSYANLVERQGQVLNHLAANYHQSNERLVTVETAQNNQSAALTLFLKGLEERYSRLLSDVTSAFSEKFKSHENALDAVVEDLIFGVKAIKELNTKIVPSIEIRLESATKKTVDDLKECSASVTELSETAQNAVTPLVAVVENLSDLKIAIKNEIAEMSLARIKVINVSTTQIEKVGSDSSRSASGFMQTFFDSGMEKLRNLDQTTQGMMRDVDRRSSTSMRLGSDTITSLKDLASEIVVMLPGLADAESIQKLLKSLGNIELAQQSMSSEIEELKKDRDSNDENTRALSKSLEDMSGKMLGGDDE